MVTAPAWTENRLRVEDRAAHDWYRFVLSFPPHLVREYLQRFNIRPQHCILDPFCGTGTTLVECKKLGISSVGIEANPIACFASRVKTDWEIDPRRLVAHASSIADLATKQLAAEGIDNEGRLPLFRKPNKIAPTLRTLPIPVQRLLLKGSISPLPLHKTLVLLDTLEKHRDGRCEPHEHLALAKSIVYDISNLHFGPEVGVAPPKSDAPVVTLWLDEVHAIAKDVELLRDRAHTPSAVHLADAREPLRLLRAESIDAVITSPPYPNEKDYTRTTRLESVLLGFLKSKEDLRSLKRRLVKSNTRGVYKTDSDDLLIADNAEISSIATAIEKRRVELGKTSGFERLYPRVTKLYFGGMSRHLANLRTALRPGARLAYVVGDQASYLRVLIRTGRILSSIAESLGYEVLGIDLFRTRWATATKEQLREEVVLLRWPGQ